MTGLTGIVLAAGINRRLGETPRPKSLLELAHDGPTFLDRQVRILRSLGVSTVLIVVSDPKLDSWPRGEGVHLVVNPFDTADTGSTLSMLCALRSEDLPATVGLLVSDADIVYEVELMRWIVDRCDRSRLFVAPATAGDDEEVRVYGTDNSHPLLIGKGIHPSMVRGSHLLGESIGVVHVADREREFVHETSRWLTGWPPGDAAYGFSGARSEHEEVWQYCFTAGQMEVACVDESLLFSECDTIDDLEFIRRELFPAIVDRDSGRPGVSGEGRPRR